MTTKFGGTPRLPIRKGSEVKVDFEERIIRNPALGSTVLWQFARDYTDHSGDGSAPNLLAFLLVYPMLFHAATVRAIKGMNFESGFSKALIDQPEISIGLQARLRSTAVPALQTLNFACAAGLLRREEGAGIPFFRPEGTTLPSGFKDARYSVRDMIAAARRLGRWIASDGVEATCLRLDVRF